MLKNFIITSLRTFTRNKTFFGLGVVGLTLSISCIISLYAIVNYQSNYDQHQENGEQIFRIIGEYNFGDNQGRTQTVPHPLSKGIREELPNVEAISNLFLLSDQVNIPAQDDKLKKFKQSGIAFAQIDVFDILSFQWLAGSPDEMGPKDVYLSRSVASKFFGINEDFGSVLNREIILSNKYQLQVKGIYEDLPKRTDFPFEMITQYENQEGINPYFGSNVWARLNGGTQCILKLTESGNAIQEEQNINAAFEKYNVIEGYSLRLQPLKKIHTDAVGNYSGISFIKEYEIITYGICIVLAIIGAINFINLSTARAIKRAKEVGIRKVMGSSRSNLVYQFLFEGLLIVISSVIVGFFLANQIIIAFQSLVNFEITLSDIPLGDWVVFSLSIVVVMTVLSGLYPAMILSGYSPLIAIKTKVSNIDRQSKIPLRKILVGVQFSFTILLIVCAMVIFSQMNYMKNYDVGFRSDGIISVVFPEPNLNDQKRLQLLIESEPEFTGTSLHLGSPIARTNNTDKYFNPENAKEETIKMLMKGIDEDYLELFDLKLISGRNLSSNSPEGHALITENALSQFKLGSPQEAIGKVVEASWGGKFKIQGVVNSFNSYSLNREQLPSLLVYRPDQFYEMAITLSPEGQKDMNASVKKLESLWDEVYPNLLIQYDFLDEQIAARYQFEDIIAKCTTFYVIIALIISILGLYGLTDYIANAKKKEIGIRKVVGAEIKQILGLFIKEVLPILLISFVLAATASYYAMSLWLNGFDYRISLGWEIVLITFLSIAAITALTMGYRSYKAASINPVNVLKDE